MAVTKKETVDTTEDMVDIFIPRGQSNEDPNLFVSVNGMNWLLPRGKKSKVPRYIADEIERSFEAQQRLDELKEAKMNEAIETAKAYALA